MLCLHLWIGESERELRARGGTTSHHTHNNREKVHSTIFVCKQREREIYIEKWRALDSSSKSFRHLLTECENMQKLLHIICANLKACSILCMLFAYIFIIFSLAIFFSSVQWFFFLFATFIFSPIFPLHPAFCSLPIFPMLQNNIYRKNIAITWLFLCIYRTASIAQQKPNFINLNGIWLVFGRWRCKTTIYSRFTRSNTRDVIRHWINILHIFYCCCCCCSCCFRCCGSGTTSNHNHMQHLQHSNVVNRKSNNFPHSSTWLNVSRSHLEANSITKAIAELSPFVYYVAHWYFVLVCFVSFSVEKVTKQERERASERWNKKWAS